MLKNSNVSLGTIQKQWKFIIRKYVQQVLHTTEFASLTIDSWITKAIDAYVTIAIHGNTDEFRPFSFVLNTAVLAEHHTAENLPNETTNIMERWDLQDKTVATVHDNASNITKAVTGTDNTKLGFTVPRFAHTLQVSWNKGLVITDIGNFKKM